MMRTELTGIADLSRLKKCEANHSVSGTEIESTDATTMFTVVWVVLPTITPEIL